MENQKESESSGPAEVSGSFAIYFHGMRILFHALIFPFSHYRSQGIQN